MRYLSIDFGTVLTKAAIFDSETGQLVLVQMNGNDDDFGLTAHKVKYEMPTAVFYDKHTQKYKIGQEAVNSRATDPDNFHHLFKPKLSEEQYVSQYYIPFLEEVLKDVVIKAQGTINPHNTFDKILLTVPSSTIQDDNRWTNMVSAISNAITQLEEQEQQQIIPRTSDDDLKNHIEIIKEPEAASYSILKKSISNYTNGDLFLVYDFGGGTFDPALLEFRNKTLRSIGEWNSDIPRGKNIGGIYIDELIKADVVQSPNCESFEETVNFFSNCQLSETGQFIRPENVSRQEWRIMKNNLETLETLSITAKHEFSNSDIDKFYKSEDDEYEYELTRDDYYDMIEPLIDDTIQCCSILLSDYGYSWKDIKEVFLVGGSSMIPLVREKLEAKCKQEDATFTIPSMSSEYDYLHAVALGAALFNKLKPTNEQRFEFGIEALKQQDWAESEYQFTEGKSYYGLGLMEYEGLGRKKLYKKAYNIFSAHNEDPKCAFMQALMLFRGEGVKKDDKQALNIVAKMLEYLEKHKLLDRLYSTASKGLQSLMRVVGMNEKEMKKQDELSTQIHLALAAKGNVLNKILSGNEETDDFELVYNNNFYKIV